MAIYLDIVWLLNFFFDSFLLYVTGWILKRDLVIHKIFLGGLFGSFIIFALLLQWSFLTTPIMKIIISIMMVVIAFGYKKMTYIMTNLAVFYFCTFLAGGALIGTHYLINFDFKAWNASFISHVKGFGDPISWLFVLIGFPIVIHFSKSTFQKFESVSLNYEQIIPITIHIFQQSIKLNGLIDSGNQLYEPITKRPVMIVSMKNCHHLFPSELRTIFEKPESFIQGNFDGKIPDPWLQRMVMIPYRVVGQENQWLLGLKPDYVSMIKNGEICKAEQLVIAFVQQNLSKEALFDCIIHPKIITDAIKRKVS